MKSIKKIVMTGLCVLALAGCGSAKENAADETPESSADTEIAVPFHEADSEEEAEKEAGFVISVPETVNGAVSRKFIVFNDHTLIDVRYLDAEGNEVLSVRKCTEQENVSGDYNEYAEEKTVVSGSVTVTAKENDGTVYTAEWNDGTYGYSLHSDAGMDEDTLVSLVSEIG